MSPGLIGGLLVCAAGGAGGLMAAGELAARHRFLQAMAAGTARMREEIARFSTPLAPLLESLGGEAEAGFFFAAMGKSGGWSAAVEEAGRRFFLTEADRRALMRLGEGLGRCGRSDVLRRLAAAEGEISRRAAEAGELRRKYAKILRFGGFAIGLTAALLL